MQQITITFSDDDTLPDRLRKMANLHQTTPQDIIERALVEYLGEFALNPIPEGYRPKNLLELVRARGLLRPAES